MFSKNKTRFEVEIVKSGLMGTSLYINAKIGNEVFDKAMKCHLDEEEKTIYLDDICIEGNTSGFFGFLHEYQNYINKGYGSQMMEILLKYAKDNSYKTIVGKLVCNDNLCFNCGCVVDGNYCSNCGRKHE